MWTFLYWICITFVSIVVVCVAISIVLNVVDALWSVIKPKPSWSVGFYDESRPGQYLTKASAIFSKNGCRPTDIRLIVTTLESFEYLDIRDYPRNTVVVIIDAKCRYSGLLARTLSRLTDEHALLLHRCGLKGEIPGARRPNIFTPIGMVTPKHDHLQHYSSDMVNW